MPTLPVPRSSSAPAAGNRRPAARLLQPLGRLAGLLFGELLAFTGSVLGGAMPRPVLARVERLAGPGC